MEKNNHIRFSSKTILFIAVILVIDIIVSLLAYSKISQSLFQERSSNTSQLMAKITQSVDNSIGHRWDRVHRLANELSDIQPASIAEAEATLEKMKSYLTNGPLDLYLIDSQGMCYTSQGAVSRWKEIPLLLSANQDELLVDTDMASPLMYYLTDLPTPIQCQDTTLTHLCLAYDLSFLEDAFQISEYGQDSAAFIVEDNGPQLYSLLTDPQFSGESHILSGLSQLTYRYGCSYKQLLNDLDQRIGGCICLSYQGERYYVAYQPMASGNWHAFLVLPEEQVGSASRVFLHSIILSTAVIGLGAAAVLASVIFISTHQLNQQREAMNLQLRKAVSAERSANQAKTMFLSAMSHDIRTPMNAIVGMTTLAMKNLEDPEYVKNCLSKVTLASNHLLTLINDILDISKVESGKMALNPVVFSIADAVSNLASIVRPQIAAKHQNFSLRVHNIQREYLFADELRLNQIFINLLTNAVKYTPTGGTITVDLYQEALEDQPDRVQITFVVQDNGIGMSQEFQRTMYAVFSRSQDTRIHNIQGSGLGLSICKQMVDMMGGTIQCDSTEGVGTTFTVTVTLPLAEKLAEDLVLPPMKLLLVDDDPIFLETGSDTLRDLGLDPDCVSSGRAAIQAVEEKHRLNQDYPLVIIDWQMPDMDGIETTRAIRASVGEDVPIIVISAYERAEIEEAAKAAGATGFISKPFFRSTVYQSMQQILNLQDQDHSSEFITFGTLAGKRLLVAEDNDLNWEIASELLSIYSIQADRAANGSQCLDMIQASPEGKYAAILMDIQMPVMNGYSATRAIRSSQRPYVRDIPIIAMTADAFSDDIQRSIACGMNGHVAKPIHMENLLTLLEKLCKR